MEFLNKRVPKSIGGSDANRLAQELGDLPLALEQAGALQAETGMPVNEYLRLLREQASDLLAESKPSEYPVPMTAAWKLSVSKLNDKQPAALELLHCWAFFGPEPIPRDVFRQGVKSGLPRLSGILGNPILLTRAIRELGRFALAKIDTVSRTVQVHRLIQALLRDELTPAEQDGFRHEVHLLLAGAAPADPDDEANWSRYAELVSHIMPSRVARCQDPDVRRFALNVVRYLYQSGGRQSAQTFVDTFLEQWVTDSGPDDSDVIAGRLHLGNILRELGQFQESYALTGTTLEQAAQGARPRR